MNGMRLLTLSIAAFLSSSASAVTPARVTVDDLLGEWSAEGPGLEEVYSCDAPVRIGIKPDAGLAMVITAPDWSSTLQKQDGKDGKAELYDPVTGKTRITVEAYMEGTFLFAFTGGRFDGKALVMAPCY